MQHGGVPELLLGLGYNGTTGRLTVEVRHLSKSPYGRSLKSVFPPIPDREGQSIPQPGVEQGPGYVRQAVSGQQHGPGDGSGEDLHETWSTESVVQGDVYLSGILP